MSDPKKELTPEQLAKIAGGKKITSSSSSTSSSSPKGVAKHRQGGFPSSTSSKRKIEEA
jgi:hypothetical protein